MSLWSRLWHRISPLDPPARARDLEDRGDLAAAALKYEREGLLEEAIRVLLTFADADPDPASRVRTLARVLRLARQLGAPPIELEARYARARLDVLRSSVGGSASVWELSSLARELEELKELDAAEEAYGLANDRTNQARMLTAAGKFEELEKILASENERIRSNRVRIQTFAEISALATGGQRLEALRRAHVLTELDPSDEESHLLLRSLQARLVRPPQVLLDIEGDVVRLLLLPEVTIGRTEAAITLRSPLLSRHHLRISMHDEVPVVEDLATRNGTFLAGARLAAPLQVRSPLSLRLGGEISCQIEPWGNHGLRLSLGGETYWLPLASQVALGPWRLGASQENDSLRLQVPPGAPPPFLEGTIAITDGLDLCFGDVLHKDRGGPIFLRVLP